MIKSREIRGDSYQLKGNYLLNKKFNTFDLGDCSFMNRNVYY